MCAQRWFHNTSVIVQAKTLLKLVPDDGETGFVSVTGVVSPAHPHRRHSSCLL
jgi:hypothetical protein